MDVLRPFTEGDGVDPERTACGLEGPRDHREGEAELRGLARVEMRGALHMAAADELQPAGDRRGGQVMADDPSLALNNNE